MRKHDKFCSRRINRRTNKVAQQLAKKEKERNAFLVKMKVIQTQMQMVRLHESRNIV